MMASPERCSKGYEQRNLLYIGWLAACNACRDARSVRLALKPVALVMRKCQTPGVQARGRSSVSTTTDLVHCTIYREVNTNAGKFVLQKLAPISPAVREGVNTEPMFTFI